MIASSPDIKLGENEIAASRRVAKNLGKNCVYLVSCGARHFFFLKPIDCQDDRVFIALQDRARCGISIGDEVSLEPISDELVTLVPARFASVKGVVDVVKGRLRRKSDHVFLPEKLIRDMGLKHGDNVRVAGNKAVPRKVRSTADNYVLLPKDAISEVGLVDYLTIEKMR